jgi:segregation and condensation protein B
MKLQAPRTRIGPPEAELLPAVIESLLFVAAEPQEIATLAKSLSVPRQRIEQAIDQLIALRDGRGVFVQRVGDLVQLATVPEAGPYIEQFLEVDYGHLSRAALETLAIIAYRAPTTRAVIEAVRGVNSDHAVATLLARGLIEDVGRAPGPGRPVLFAPSVRFLEYFGIQRAEDLPPLPPENQEQLAQSAEAVEDAEANGAHAEPPASPEAEDDRPGRERAHTAGHASGEG